jgi:hypothetical protein
VNRYLQPWLDSSEQKARYLEEIKGHIDYCLANIGKNYSALDKKKAGGFWPHEGLGVLTYALIAHKYSQYGDGGKTGDYYYLNWLHYSTPQAEETRWPRPEGEYDDPFLSAIGSWSFAGDYKQLAKHYEDYIIHAFSPLKTGSREVRIQEMKKEYPHWDTERKKSYNRAWKKLEKYKTLARTTKPKPLDPAVQNHEWFYSDKQEEILKALQYYSNNKVSFMLEKAQEHKDPMVAAKAQEYLKLLK